MNPSIGIVGAGPAGCYLAQALRKKWGQSPIDLIDQLSVPFGLVRYGVACDHQGTKGVIRQFARLFEREQVRFIGNLQIGNDVSLEELRQIYDVVVLSVGLYQDRQLGLEGEDSKGIYGSGVITRLFNDYPDFSLSTAQSQAITQSQIDKSQVHFGKNLVVIGQGNVAMDLVRLFAKKGDEWNGSDLSPDNQKLIEHSEVQTISVVGRSPMEDSKFDLVMLKEFLKLKNAQFKIHGEALPQTHPKLEVFQQLIEQSDAQAPCTISFYFGYTPKQFIARQEHVEGVVFSNQLTLPATSVFTAIGYEPHFKHDHLLDDMTCLQTGRLAKGLYCAGWFKRGPKGTIPENRTDAKSVAEQIIQDVESGTIPIQPCQIQTSQRHNFFEKLASHQTLVDYEGWQKIDAYEQAQKPPHRTRLKVSDKRLLLNLATK